MITQLEKDDLLFDVSEVLNSFQFIMRVTIYDRDTLRVISVSDIHEGQLKQELEKDSLSYLLQEPHRREELSKYIVQNIHYDDARRKAYFM